MGLNQTEQTSENLRAQVVLPLNGIKALVWCLRTVHLALPVCKRHSPRKEKLGTENKIQPSFNRFATWLKGGGEQQQQTVTLETRFSLAGLQRNVVFHLS